MFYNQTSSLVPNLFNTSIEEEEVKNNANKRLFKDIANQNIKNRSKNPS